MSYIMHRRNRRVASRFWEILELIHLAIIQLKFSWGPPFLRTVLRVSVDNVRA